MMASSWAWLFDVGSTFTKALAVDLSDPGRVVTAQAPTTVSTDVRHGFLAAIALAEAAGAPEIGASAFRAASSSAAGGLALVVCGLARRLTLEAGRICALGAGARIVGAWTHRLTALDIEQMASLKPDIVLLTGGIDGGDREALLASAAELAEGRPCGCFIVAGNREVSREAADRLEQAGLRAVVVDNVLPELDRLNVEPARRAIREEFLREIVRGKGVAELRRELSLDIVPTPSAVMEAVRFIAGDLFEAPLMVVEVGGATTNVHSYADGAPRDSGTVRRGLPEMALKRTVEGDLGVRASADSLLAQAGIDLLSEGIEDLSPSAIRTYVEGLAAVPSTLPSRSGERGLDAAMAAFAAGAAIGRHAGRAPRAEWKRIRSVWKGPSRRPDPHRHGRLHSQG